HHRITLELNKYQVMFLVPFRGSGVNDGSPSNKKKPTKRDNVSANRNKLVPKTQPAKTVQNGISEIQKKPEGKNVTDILRQRLHQKIEESRGQGPPKDPSSEEVKKKRERRKQERGKGKQEKLIWSSLKSKDEGKAQRKKKWAQRSQQVMQKMQKWQDKRRRKIKKCKDAKMEKRKQRARKKCCVLPEDL
uniref:Uncharacterized protein n=1 Tax=Cyprinus carpio TaxID=7962 RepID=A0A8C1R420_CYPCA